MPRFVALILLILLATGIGAVQAQDSLTQPGAVAALYRLKTDASYVETCFAPCDCAPPEELLTMRGTFVLGPAMPGDVVDFRQVSQIVWTAHTEDTLVHRFHGNGDYRITNFSPDREHSLNLNLSIDDEPKQFFFSDFVPVASDEKEIDIKVSINGMFCQDTVIRVSAAPVPPAEILSYRLVARSSYQQGCFDPCDCLLGKPAPMVGGFDLVPLFVAGNYAEYAVLGARFAAPGPVGEPPVGLAGPGRYVLIQGFAGPIQAMGLALAVNGAGPPLLFDQEPANATAVFPDIDIRVDMNDMVCFDRVLNIRARPGR